MEFTYTRHQTPRGALPDAEVGDKLYIIKNVSHLRLTYQIRVLTYMAQSRGKKFIVRLPKDAKLHSSLREFVKNFSAVIKIERT